MSNSGTLSNSARNCWLHSIYWKMTDSRRILVQIRIYGIRVSQLDFNWIIVVTATFDRELERLVRFSHGQTCRATLDERRPRSTFTYGGHFLDINIDFIPVLSLEETADPRSFTGPLFFSPSSLSTRDRNNISKRRPG